MTLVGTNGSSADSGMVMYPAGHARNTVADLDGILAHKFNLLGSLCGPDSDSLVARFSNLDTKSAAEIGAINDFDIVAKTDFEDA